MTVSTEVDHNDYTGNGVTTSFPYTFRIFNKTDLMVQVVDLNENISVLILDTDYSVTGAGSYSGGSVVLSSPLANGWQISISRELPATQETDLRNQGKFFAEVHEDAFDKLTMLIQQCFSFLRLALRRPSFIANYYDALNNRIRNLRDPSQAQDAATKNYVDGQIVDNTNAWKAGDAVLDQKIDENFRRTLRVPESSVNVLPPLDARKNSIFGWDSNGQSFPLFAMTETADLAIKLASHTPGLGNGLLGVKNSSATTQDWIDGEMKSLFLYLSASKIASVIAGISTDVTAELQSAMNDSITIWIPAGKYYVTSSITVAANSGLVGPGARMVSIDNQGSSHTFIFGAGGYIRGWKPWRGFKVTATGNNTADAWTFYYSSREDGSGNPDYTVAQHFSEIEIESYGKIGGGWYLQECFRVVVRDCGATGLSWCFRLVGSVVQTTIDNFVHNGDSSVVMSGQTYTFGLTTELKAYSSGSSFSPEGLTVSNTRFVRQGVGCRITGGLLLTFDAVEFDYSGRYGALYNGGSQVSFNDCYVGVQANRPNDFVGFLVPATATNVSEAVNIRGCTVNMATNTNADAASYTQYGVQIGNSATPAKSTLVDGCTFRGNGYTAGIYVYAGSNTHLSSNRFQYTGVNILVDSASSFTMMNNSGNGSGTYSLTSSSATAKWFIINNTETFSTFSHPNPQYVFAFNTNYTTSNIRRINRASSAVNTSIAAGAVYNHTISVNTSLVASVPVGGVIPNGLIFSAKPATTTSVVITFYNPTNAAITLNTTLYVDVIYEPI